MKIKPFKNSTSAMLLIFCIGILSACSSSKNSISINSNEPAISGKAQSATNDKSTPENKSKENKATAANNQDDSAENNFQFETKEFSAAKGSGGDPTEPDNWNFAEGADKYTLTKEGRGKRTDGEKRVTDFSVTLENQAALSNTLYFTKYKGDLVLLYGATNGEDGWGAIVRLDGKTLKEKWNANISGFNIGKGLVENQNAYLGASGFAGKIDLETGKYLWKHADLFEKYRKSGGFNIMETPALKGDSIIFSEKVGNGSTNSIVFDKKTGKIGKVDVQ